MPNALRIIEGFHQEGFEFLSNFFLAEVSYGPYRFPSVEHAYQFAKVPKDKISKEFAKKFSECSPGKAKKFGADLKTKDGLFRPDWEEIKEKVMLHLLRQKFEIKHLQERLLQTGNAEIIEANLWHDQFWGDCRCCEVKPGERKYGQKQKCRKLGLNMLGKLLMQVRAEALLRSPYRCPQCGSSQELGQIDIISNCLALGHFEGTEFIFDGETKINWDEQKSMHDPVHYFCRTCEHEFTLPIQEKQS